VRWNIFIRIQGYSFNFIDKLIFVPHSVVIFFSAVLFMFFGSIHFIEGSKVVNIFLPQIRGLLRLIFLSTKFIFPLKNSLYYG